MSDIWSQKTEYYDDGVKFGTGPEMIAEIKSIRSELEEARHRIAELEHAEAWPCDGVGDEYGNFICKKDEVIVGLNKNLAAKDARIAELEAGLHQIIAGARSQGPFEGMSWQQAEIIALKALGPNEETLASMQEARAGGGEKFASVEALMKDLDSDA